MSMYVTAEAADDHSPLHPRGVVHVELGTLPIGMHLRLSIEEANHLGEQVAAALSELGALWDWGI